MAASPPHAVVTGAGSGIGAATARALAGQGYAVTAVDRHFADQPDTPYTCHTLDLRDSRACTELIAALEGDLRLLINVAAVRPEAGVLDEDPDAFRLAMEVNLIAPFVLLQAAVKRMESGGSITNVSSGAAYGKRNLAAYGASKAALLSLTATAAMELDALGIRVNAILPGTTDTPMLTGAKSFVDSGDRRYPRNVGGRVLRPDDIAGGIVRVATDPTLSGAIVPIGLLPVAW
jgi:NAD(P)-dependent dehydrogenase (short-subunit alcohol dehydrogenase family)